EAVLRVRVGPLRMRLLAGRDDAVSAAAERLLTAWRRAEQVELVAAVGRDLGVVGAVRESGRPARVEEAALVGDDQRLRLVALRIGRNRRREREPLGAA